MARRGRGNEHVAVYDYIRFFAAMYVAYFHLAYWSWADDGGTTYQVARGIYRYPELAGSASLGWVGVEIFFVLSGIVIAMTSNGASAEAFARNRFLRLWPALSMCAVVSFTVAVAFHAYGLLSSISRLLHTWVLWPTGPWIDGVYWSLVVEVVFYAAVLLLILFDLNRYCGRFALCLAVYSVLCNAWNFVGDDVMDSFAFRFGLGQYGCFFSLGIAIFLAGRQQMTVWLSATLVISLIGCVAELIYHAGAHEVTGLGVPALILVWGLAVALMCLGSIGAAPITALPQARTLGLLTYPLYLVHDLTGAAILRVEGVIHMPRWLALLVALAGVVVLAWAITTVAEPALRGVMRAMIAKGESRMEKAAILRRLFAPSRPLEQGAQ